MARRARVGRALYRTASGYQSWWRNEDDRQEWSPVFDTPHEAAKWRDERRDERAVQLQTPKQIRILERLRVHTTPALAEAERDRKTRRDTITRAVWDFDARTEYDEDDTLRVQRERRYYWQ
jgi:hypothetical protein